MTLNRRNAKWYALGFGAGAAVALAGSVWFLNNILEERASLEWPHKPGTITASYSERTCGGAKSFHTWQALIEYKYAVAGIDHRGHRAAGTKMFCAAEREVVTKWLEANYPVGKRVEVYFNPADPDAAFLHPGVVNVVEVAMVFCLAIVSALMALGMRIARRVAAAAAAGY